MVWKICFDDLTPTNITGDLHNYMEWKYIIAAVCDLLSFTCSSDMAQYQYMN